MNGMLQRHDVYREGVECRQHEAREWAQANALGRLSARARDQDAQHPARARILAVASAMAVGLAILAILI